MPIDTRELEQRATFGDKYTRNNLMKTFYNDRMARVNTDIRKAKDEKTYNKLKEIKQETLYKVSKYNLRNYKS